ncbi:CoA-substrate-specific enzyme activase, putative [Rhodococcoides kyotonense]|uniref:CoA-substrate-specific enzyme activase, putative n=2 Tax=Rhodococcoides kyotonense TaxID=398843 RepID=A0A239K035_9NOCA|nr:CoA-substrate-specific enzyme activase, putative [Rhodococcus kyotonensis]
MGVDLGSTSAKAVVLDASGAFLGSSAIQMGAVSRAGMHRAIAEALQRASVTPGEIAGTISTGYGRRLVPNVGRSFTEITCHARGVAALCPGVRLIIDIGGQDSKVIAVDEDGLVDDFAMNDRCASGTGRFFEVLARAIECEVDELADLALAGNKNLEVSSMCATFAETEIVSLLASGSERTDIAASVHRAVSARTLGLIAQVGKKKPVVMTGGVAKNAAAVHFLSEALGLPIDVPADPQTTGAYGAALLALDAGDRDTPPDVRLADPASSVDRACQDCSGTVELKMPAIRLM